jgi:hypothetical protein
VKQLRELTAREMYIVRAALDTFSDLVEDSSIPVAGVGEMAGGVDAAEIARIMGAFPEAPGPVQLEIRAEFERRGWQYWHTGGGIFCWMKQNEGADRRYYIGDADGNGCDFESWDVACGADVMRLDGEYLDESPNFKTVREAIEWADKVAP